MNNCNSSFADFDDVEKQIQCLELLKEMKKLLKDSIGAQYLKEGINTAIIGKPNVGKSTLLNALLNEDKAIVTNIPGTTRDIIEAKINLGRITLNLLDTAGIRKTSDIVEQIGVEKSRKQLEKADFVLMVLDATTDLTEDEIEIIQILENKPHLKIVNKTDLKVELSDIKDGIYISAHNKTDISELEDKIVNQILKDVDVNENSTYLSNARQISKLQLAINSLNEAVAAIQDNAYIDFVDIYLREAYNYMGEIVGDTATDSLLNELFSKFCLGK